MLGDLEGMVDEKIKERCTFREVRLEIKKGRRGERVEGSEFQSKDAGYRKKKNSRNIEMNPQMI